MLRWRLLIGAALIAALVGLCWLDAHGPRPGIVLACVAIGAAALAAGEMRRLFRRRGVVLTTSAVYMGTVVPVVVSAIPIFFPILQMNSTLGSAGWLGLGMTLGLMAVFAGEMRQFTAPGESIGNVAHAALSSLYVGGLMGTLIQLRLSEAPGSIAGFRGQFALIALIATVKLSDTCQYAVGRMFGRHKLAPLISPGKTWEGAIGGILLATIISAATMAWLTQGSAGWRPSHLLLCGCYALAVAVTGITGDLAESLLKRDAGVKDSSDWLPGFGGVLDLLDSILFAAPIGYIWTVWGVIGLV